MIFEVGTSNGILGGWILTVYGCVGWSCWGNSDFCGQKISVVLPFSQ